MEAPTVIVMEKAALTPRANKDGAVTDYKHGFKVVCTNVVATHAQQRQLDALLNDR